MAGEVSPCPNCGRGNPPALDSCQTCGMPLRVGRGSSAVTVPQRRWLFWLAVLGLSGSGLTLAIALSHPSRPTTSHSATLSTTAASTPELPPPAAPSATTVAANSDPLSREQRPAETSTSKLDESPTDLIPRLDEEARAALPPGTVHHGRVQVSGRLDSLMTEMALHQNLNRFEMCYRQGLAENPRLKGSVSVRFVVGRNGEVANVANDGSDLADHRVVQCIQLAIQRMELPRPDGGGIAVVKYKLALTPG